LPDAIRIAAAALVCVAALFDLKYRRIPNWLNGAGLITGFALQTMLRGWAGLRDAAAGAAFAFLVYLALFALRAMGGGDVKLMTALGAILGPYDWFWVLLYASITGGVIAVILLLLRGTLLKTLFRVGIVLGDLSHLRAPYRSNPEMDVSHPQAVTLPHGVSVAIGCLLFLAASTWKL